MPDTLLVAMKVRCLIQFQGCEGRVGEGKNIFQRISRVAFLPHGTVKEARERVEIFSQLLSFRPVLLYIYHVVRLLQALHRVIRSQVRSKQERENPSLIVMQIFAFNLYKNNFFPSPERPIDIFL